MPAVAMAKEYDQNSSNQATANKAAAEWLSAAARAAVNISPGRMNILDLGSATGKNSSKELQPAIAIMREAEENCEIVVCHVDTPGNDWNQLFQTINSLPGSYLADASQGNVFGYGQAKSFYEQVAPTGSVALIYSGLLTGAITVKLCRDRVAGDGTHVYVKTLESEEVTASSYAMSFHWVAQSKPLSDCWFQHPDTKDVQTYAANRQLAAEGWLQLLQQRARELLPGGFLVATAATLKGSEGLNQFIAWTNEGWREAASFGQISQQEFDSIAGGHWLRSREEWLAPFEGEMRDVFEVVHFNEYTVTDPQWLEYQNGKESQPERASKLAEAYCRWTFAVGGGVIASHLKHRSPDDVAKVVATMKARFVQLATSSPTEGKMPIALIVLKRKTAS